MPAMSPTVWDRARRAAVLAVYCREPSSAVVASRLPWRSVMSPRRVLDAESLVLWMSEAQIEPWVYTVMANHTARAMNIVTTSMPTKRMLRRSSFMKITSQ